jgi:hypothetical protein
MAKDGHGPPKVSPGLALPHPSMPCGWAIPEMALWNMAILAGPTCRAGSLLPFSTLLDTQRCTPKVAAHNQARISLGSKAP